MSSPHSGRKLYALFFMLGFAMEFTQTAELFWMRQVDFSIAESLQNGYIINTAYALRVVFGYASDLAGFRSLQLALLFIMSMIMWIALCTNRDAIPRYSAVAMLAVAEVGCAAGLTVADSYMIRAARRPGRAVDVPAACIRARLVGGKLLAQPIGAYALGLAGNDPYVVFGAQAVWFGLMAAFVGFAFCSSDEDHEDDQAYAQVVSEPAADTKTDPEVATTQTAPNNKTGENDNIAQFIVFFIVLASLPDPGQSVSYFLIGPAQFSATDLGNLDLLAGIGMLLGTAYAFTHVHNACMVMANVNVAGSLATAVVVSRVWSNTVLDDRVIVFASAFLLSVAASAVNTTYSVMAAAQSRRGLEATYYACFVSLPLVGQVVGFATTLAATRALRINHDHFHELMTFVFITGYIALAALPLPVLFKHSFLRQQRVTPPSPGR